MVVWQLADEVRQQTFGLTARPAFKADLKLHSLTEDAAHSVCRSIYPAMGGWLAYLTRTDEPSLDRTSKRRQNRTD